jgi:hypothetical protein
MRRALRACNVVLGLQLCLWALGAIAGTDAEPRGLDLLERCHQLEDGGEAQARDHGYCLGYIVGFVSGFAARDVAGREGRFCPPEDARIVDYANAVNEWLVANPEGLEKIAAVVALRAFQWKFPCDPSVTREPGGKAQ